MLTFTPTDCRVNDLRIRETLIIAEHRAALEHGAPTSRRRTSLVGWLTLALSRSVQVRSQRRSPRAGMLAAPRS